VEDEPTVQHIKSETTAMTYRAPITGHAVVPKHGAGLPAPPVEKPAHYGDFAATITTAWEEAGTGFAPTC